MYKIIHFFASFGQNRTNNPTHVSHPSKDGPHCYTIPSPPEGYAIEIELVKIER